MNARVAVRCGAELHPSALLRAVTAAPVRQRGANNFSHTRVTLKKRDTHAIHPLPFWGQFLLKLGKKFTLQLNSCVQLRKYRIYRGFAREIKWKICVDNFLLTQNNCFVIMKLIFRTFSDESWCFFVSPCRNITALLIVTLALLNLIRNYNFQENW